MAARQTEFEEQIDTGETQPEHAERD